MRFRIRLSRISRESYLPLNYQYELSAAIYRIIDRADSDFSEFLHSRGYLAFGRQFRLFTFSRLGFQGYKVIHEAARIEHFGQEAWFEISFLVDRAAEEFVKGLFMSQEFGLGDKISRIIYQVSHIEAVAPPLFKETMSYRCLSPIFIRSKRADGGEDYLKPESTDYEDLLFRGLVSKASAFVSTENNGAIFHGDGPRFSLVPRGKIYKNGVVIKQMTAEETKLIGYMYEFRLTAPVELQEIGYYAGFGQLNSQGFGCVEIKK